MRVRKATQTDAGPIAHVHVTAWQACCRGMMPDEFLDRLSVSDREASWRKALHAAGRIFLVCRSERQTVGFAACGPTRDQDKDASLVDELYAIYVLPDFWGGGDAAMLCGSVSRRRFGNIRGAERLVAQRQHARQAVLRARRLPDGYDAVKDAHIAGIKLPEVRYSKRLPR